MSLARMVGCAVFAGLAVSVGSVSADVIMRLAPGELDLPPGGSVTFQVMLEADPVYLGESTYTASIDAAGDFQIDITERGVGDDEVEVTQVGAVAHTIIDVGDSDLDGDIDLIDARDLQNCFTGSDGGVSEGCEAMDPDGDDDVDLGDHTIWATMMTGPG